MIDVNEKKSITLLAEFFDDNGEAVQPSSGSYRIDDVSSGDEVKGDTPFTPTGVTHEIKITAAENAIVNSAKKSEVKRVTVSWNYGIGKDSNDEYKYKVINLTKVT